MRVVDTADEFAEALMGAQREATSSFGNAKVLVEKYLLRPRHVEIQVFADSHGNVVYLFERDCSIQRRHQKVLEEAPAPHLSAATREKMGAAAIAVAKAVNYVGAGTVEFLLDANEDFFFMEMNTRLQVEHPITEMITGVDLVEWQIKIAQGEKLPCTQADLKINGHAFEVRLYAEDPARDFMPSAGQIQFLQFPLESDCVRVDTGVREAPYGDGDVISMHYDPMIAKIITWGHDRAAALQTMAEALDETHITGLKSNLHFLRALVRHPAFKDGNISTNFIKEHHDDLLPVNVATPSRETLALAVIGILHQQEQAHLEMLEKSTEQNSPWFDFGAWRIGGNDTQNFSFRNEAGEYTVTVTDSRLKFADGTVIEFSYTPCDFNMGFIAALQGKQIEAVVDRQGQTVTVCYAGHDDTLIYLDPLHSENSDEEVSGKLTAPMPGKVVAIRVTVGAAVKKGQPLVIVEAMKMEHTIVAPMDGIIDKIHAAIGHQVDEKYELVSMQ
jgi:3-methylcrotonyl-CoA carboxylase alpha subunit